VSERLPDADDREEFTDAVRRDAWARCGGRCEGCGKSLAGIRYTYDHTIPFRRSRDSTLANCKVLCNDGPESCDHRKTYGEDLPGIAANKRYGKNRLPLDIGRPEKKPGKIKTRGFKQGVKRPFPQSRNNLRKAR
jgi:5-methylcytosine-specific restriction protein A